MDDLPTEEEYKAFKEHLRRLMESAAQLDHWARFEILMCEAASAPHPYLVHGFATGCMVYALEKDGLEGDAYVLWAELGDWYELWDDREAVEAESWMREAAREWLTLPDCRCVREEYFERWRDKVGARLAKLPSPWQGTNTG